jgi:hypothetical protein
MKYFALKAWLALSFVCVPVRVQGRPILTSITEYDEIRFSAKNVSRVQNIDVADNVPICHFAMVMPFSGFRPTRIPLKNGVFQGLAAVLLAVQHLNTGNGTIVQQVEGLNARCDIRFTTETFDTGLSQIEAVDHIINLISRQPVEEQLPCALIGAARSAVSIPTSIITGLRGYPQISPISTSTQLEDTSQFQLFGRTIPSDAGTAVPAILYLRYELGVKHLAVLHVNDAYGNSYALGLQLAAAEFAPDMVIASYDFPFEATPDTVKRTIGLLKNTQFRYFFGIIFSTVHYEAFMTEAYNQGIAGTGLHNWIFSDSVSTSILADPFESGSPLHLASKGASRIGAVGGVPGIELYDLFLESMLDLDNPEDIEVVQSKHPSYLKEADYEPLQIEDDPEFFLKAAVGVVPFLYDATIALGLAACNATRDGQFFNGTTHFETFKTTTFEGASGTNVYDNQTGTRVASSARFTLLNFVEDQLEEGQTIRLHAVESDVFRDGKWIQVEQLVFNDGSTVPPSDLPDAHEDDNYIGAALRGIGLGMAGLILFVSIGFTLWTAMNRNSRVVKASQPVFLCMITVGCFLMGSSLIFLSFDDEVVSTNACSAFCVVIPWLVFMGWILAFSALFTKTNRVNQIFHNPTYKRIKVTVWDVMKPAVALMSVTILVLVLWTVLEPPSWEREVSLVDQFGREVETKGSCSYEGGLPYFSVLAIVFFGVLAYACYEAYVARNVSTEFAESEYIALVLVAIVLVSFMGVPVMIIAKDEPKARFFVAGGIIFIVCLAILILIFVPKFLALRRENKSESVIIRSAQRNAGQVSSLRPRVAVSGVDLPSAVFNNQITNIEEEEDPDPDDGIKVLHHPKEVQNLKEQIAELKSQNKSLTSQMAKTRYSHSETQSLAVEPMSQASVATSINMAGDIRHSEHHVDSDDDETMIK